MTPDTFSPPCDDAAEWASLEASHRYDHRTGMHYPDEKKHVGPKVSSRPHPQSYGADLPLTPLTWGELTRTTAAERKHLARRPLVVRQGPITDELVKETNARLVYGEATAATIARKREKVRARSVELSLDLHSVA